MKIKLNIKSILVIAIIGVLSLLVFNKSFAAVTGKVSVDTANIRKLTDTTSTIVEQASKGETVQIIEKDGDWYKVKYNGVQGYVRSDLLEVNESVAEATTPAPVEDKKEETKTEEPKNETTQNYTSVNNTEEKQENTATENDNSKSIIEGMYSTTADVKLKLVPLVNGNNIKDISKDATVNVLEVYNNWALAECGMDRGWLLYSKLNKVEETAQQPENNQEEKKEEEKTEEKTEEKVEEKAEETKQEEKSTEVAVQEKTMYVNWDVVIVREKATKASDVVTSLNKATAVTVTAKDGEWSKVKVNGNVGYIKTTLLSETKPETTTSRSLEQERQEVQSATQQNQTEASAQTSSSGLGQQVCAYARQYLGCKYVYGGTTPSGFDCSGFTQYVFKHFGITINRTASAQASNGTYVAKSDLQAGDLLIFSGHAGIYLGDGTFIHAANPSKGVIVTSLSDSYYVKNYITARRIVN
ncbi:MAG: C40 family peptidase [Clostridia bacterium]|nr:C40 family peptidase [Clostridia bacterium]